MGNNHGLLKVLQITDSGEFFRQKLCFSSDMMFILENTAYARS